MKLLDYLVNEEVSITPRNHRTFFVNSISGKKFLVKLVAEHALKNKKFVQFEEIPNIKLVTEKHIVTYEDEFYEIFELNKSISSGTIDNFHTLINLYHHSHKIKVFTDSFYSVGNMYHVAHTHNSHYGVSLGDVISKFKKRTKNLSKHVLGCKNGFFHGDVHFGNVLADKSGELYLVDLDTVRNSYVLLNLAQLFYIELFKRSTPFEQLLVEREGVLKNVSPADAKTFDFFVLLCGLNWSIRTIPFQEPDVQNRKSILVTGLSEQFSFMQEVIRYSK